MSAPWVRIVAVDGNSYPADRLAMPQAAPALALRVEPVVSTLRASIRIAREVR